MDADVDGLMIATCCLDANFDTKIAAYNAGASGSTFNPNNLPSAFIGCNEDCDDPDFYTSELIVPVTGGNQYLIRLGGHLQATGTGNITSTGSRASGRCNCTSTATGTGNSTTTGSRASGSCSCTATATRYRHHHICRQPTQRQLQLHRYPRQDHP